MCWWQQMADDLLHSIDSHNFWLLAMVHFHACILPLFLFSLSKYYTTSLQRHTNSRSTPQASMPETPGTASKSSSAVGPQDNERPNAAKIRQPTPDDLTLPSPPFHELVMLLEDISKMSSKKREFVERYIQVRCVFAKRTHSQQ
jgi:hypothetical protein